MAMAGEVLNVQVNKLFYLIAKLANLAGARDLSQRPGCWEYSVGDLDLSLNAHAEPTPCIHASEPIPPFACYLQYRGMPAGFAGISGGCVLCDGEDLLISIVESEIARLEASAPERCRASVLP